MASKVPNSIPSTEKNRPAPAGGKSLSSILPPRRRSSAEESDNGEDNDNEDVGLTVSEDDNADSDKEDDEDARIKSLGEESPDLFAFLGKDSDSDPHNTAIATTSEEDDDNDDEDNDNDNAIDDSSIEEEEEAAIRAELGRKNRRRSIPGPVSLRRLSQSQQARSRDEDHSEDSGESSDESSQSDSSSWGNEYLEDYFDQPVNPAKPSQVRTAGDLDTADNEDSGSDDESYLWQYFFSSEEADDGYDDQAVSDERSRSPSKSKTRQRHFTTPKEDGSNGEASTDEDLPMKGRGPLPVSQQMNPSGYIPSGDSTDEDDGVPPERKRRRARGTKAIEVLGSNSFSTRPPVLGSWHIKGDKNVGIIDGLTTRTLSPPPQVQQDQYVLYTGSPRNQGPPSQGGTPQGTSGGDPADPFDSLNGGRRDSLSGLFADLGDSSFDLTAPSNHNGSGVDHQSLPFLDEAEVSDLDLLELGDYINTDGMSSDDNENENEADHLDFDFDFDHPDHPAPQQQQQQQQRQFRSPVVSPYIYRSRFPSRSVPISAFRNRGSPYVNNPAYPSDNQSPLPRRSRGSSVSGRRPSLPRDAFMSPARLARRRLKKVKSGPAPRSALASHLPPQPQHDDGAQDLLGELIEIGAISPMFDFNQ